MSFVPSNYELNISRGNVSGARPLAVLGKHTSSGAASGVLWADGLYTFPSNIGIQMSVVSTSVSDTSAGTGIRSIDVHYLDANLAEKVETVVLNGTTPVNTVATNIRFVQGLHGLTFGSGKAAAGDISISNGGQPYSQIATGDVRCGCSVRMVPAGKRLVITSMYAGSSSGSAAAKTTVAIASPNFDGHDFISSSIFVPMAIATYQDNSAGLTIPCPMVFTTGQAVGMTFTTDKAATVVGSWFGWLENA